MGKIKLREIERTAYCRGCDIEMPKGTNVISTYSHRNRGQHIYFCESCAREIGMLVDTTLNTIHKFVRYWKIKLRIKG